MRIAVVGAGAVGSRVVEFLMGADSVASVVVIRNPREPQPRRTSRWVGGGLGGYRIKSASKVEFVEFGDATDLDVDVTVITAPELLERFIHLALNASSHVVAPVDEPDLLRRTLAVDAYARQLGRSVALGTAMAPGLSCVLARYLNGDGNGGGFQGGFDSVEELHVASAGTGGPTCARRHHTALAAISVDWQEGSWRRRPGGSGRELVWFPGPVGGADCYRAYLAEPLLLAPAFPSARRITARIEATRRDRLTSPLPMLRRPHPEGLTGAVRVEMRGFVGQEAVTRVLGSAGRPAVIAAAVSAVAALWAASGRLARPGAAGLAEMVDDPAGFVRDLAGYGVTVSTFVGGDV